MPDNRKGQGGVAHTKTTLWLGNGDDPREWNGYGFEVDSEDNMVSISTQLEDRNGADLEVFIMRDLFRKIRQVMDRIDKRFDKAGNPGMDYPELAATAQRLRVALERERADGAIEDMPDALFACLVQLADELRHWTDEDLT